MKIENQLHTLIMTALLFLATTTAAILITIYMSLEVAIFTLATSLLLICVFTFFVKGAKK